MMVVFNNFCSDKQRVNIIQQQDRIQRECGLEHCYVHGGNAVEAVVCMIFIVANIMQLFIYRRLNATRKTQIEIIRLLLKGLYLLKYRKELVFSSA